MGPNDPPNLPDDSPVEGSSDRTLSIGAAGSAAAAQIGPYRLLQLLGEGGMGEVWLAEQKKPIHRTVALKLIKAGMDTKVVVARFESERQALALMDHPNIARVFEAGSTAEGRPYFVMEYVPGLPITEYCDKHRMTLKERLELFVQVCDGVQHAHQKAIIHRDLKPSNVLVLEQDNKAIPKIIDFGLAKATGRRLTDNTMFTELGVMLGTPEYMSPEQADQREQNIDTRTDVYSLGVILYQLLVGVLPFEEKALRAAGIEEILRVIREQEPPKPSTRIRSLGPASAASAEKRQEQTQSFVRHLQGELDWVTMKALEKDRIRRYGSPAKPRLSRQQVCTAPSVGRCGSSFRSGPFDYLHGGDGGPSAAHRRRTRSCEPASGSRAAGSGFHEGNVQSVRPQPSARQQHHRTRTPGPRIKGNRHRAGQGPGDTGAAHGRNGRSVRKSGVVSPSASAVRTCDGHPAAC